MRSATVGAGCWASTTATSWHCTSAKPLNWHNASPPAMPTWPSCVRAANAMPAGAWPSTPLANLAWEEIDVAAQLQRRDDIASALRQLREGDANLRALGEAIERTRGDLEQAKRTFDGVREERIALGVERTRLEKATPALRRRRCPGGHAVAARGAGGAPGQPGRA